jgi:hypothetical protein
MWQKGEAQLFLLKIVLCGLQSVVLCKTLRQNEASGSRSAGGIRGMRPKGSGLQEIKQCAEFTV